MTTEEEPIQVWFLCCKRTVPFEMIFDREGFLICPEHKSRRYGWRSPGMKQYETVPFNPENPQYVWRRDYSKSPLEHDQDFVRDLLGPVESD
jgi:hypothetical protein